MIMRELIHIGNETLQLVETENGYELRSFHEHGSRDLQSWRTE